MIALEQRTGGIVLTVRAQPGARRNGVTGEHAGQLKVSVTQAPEKGKANQAILEVLATELLLKRSQITLIAGEISSQKKFHIANITIEELTARLAALINAPHNR
ncbi:MAG: hypothetical protein JWM11_6051 [Planctomycetaceae bacterium]|nr:hypothetical protein [Planctomycetaceae bacterium]